MTRLRVAVFICTVAISTLSGCAQPFTRRNFDLIQVGVDQRDDVVRLIGKPVAAGDDAEEWYYEDQSVHNSALIHFHAKSGKVSGKQWMAGDDSRLYGGNPHVAPRDGTIGDDLKHAIGLD